MKKLIPHIIILRPYGHADIISFERRKDFDQMVQMLEDDNRAFIVTNSVINCLGPAKKKVSKTSKVKAK